MARTGPSKRLGGNMQFATSKLQLEEKILQCDSAHEENLKQGKLIDAISCLEASCSFRADRLRLHNVGAQDVERAQQALVTEYNTTAMLSLQVKQQLKSSSY